MSTSLRQISVASDGLNSNQAHTFLSRARFAIAGRALLFLGTRVAFAAFWLVTLAYCVLAYVPFSYFGFIRNPLLTWIPLFLTYYARLYAMVLCGVTVTLIPHLQKDRTRRSSAAFIGLNAIACCYLWQHEVLTNLNPEPASYLWALVSLYPLVWLALLDISVAGRPRPLPERSSILDPMRPAAAAVMVSLGFGSVALARAAQGGVARELTLRGVEASLSFHLVIFLGFWVILQCIKWVSGKTPWPRPCYWALAGIFVWLLCAQALRILVLPAISFEGSAANILAASVALTIVLYVAASTLRFRSLVGRTHGTSVNPKPRLVWLFALALVASAYGIPALIGRADWDFVLQKMAAIVVWVLTLQAVCWADIRTRGKARVFAVLLLGCTGAGGYQYVRSKLENPGTQAVWNSALDIYSGGDISFKTAYSILSPSFDNGIYRDFYQFLKQRTNLGREATVGPADTRLVTRLQPSPGPSPNIFFFVIDSLRQDSISPYNRAVDYTPEIGRFAEDSVVMQNAFTRYGGTALSEPAIWVGAMQLHKHYIDPFYPMNNLQHVLEVDGYESFISFDPILRTILRPSASITELENDATQWGDLDFVSTLKKLENAIDARGDRKRPIFAYSQPQNVHTLTLERSRMKGGRKAVTAYELRRMDAAFGEFVRFLEQRNLYDNSIIILTADHGDSYGEFGRYGHCNFLFPEVIRIPLIIHLPPRMRDGLVWDTQQVSFTIDITPTLYYLLGHRPILNDEMLGRPLITKTLQEQAHYIRPYYLLVSSYGPVYAILGDNGKSLFIVDAVNSKNYFYDLAEDPLGSRNHITNRIVSANEPLVRHQVDLIDSFYGWRPPQSGD